MLKRILCLAISVAVMLTVVLVPTAGAEEWTEAHENNFEILMGLKIINAREEGDYSVFRELSKSAFINFICNMYADYGYTEAYSEEAVALAEQLGIIHAGQTDLTKPLYYDEAMTMLVRVLGYGIHAEEGGGFPYGYNAIAQKLGLADGVLAKSGERLREYDAITLLYNAINCNYVEIVSITDEGFVYGNSSDKTFLHEMRKIYKIEGIVDGTDITSIISDLNISDGKVMIDGYIYDSAVECSDYIGLYVEAYVQERDGDDEIIFVFPTDNKELIIESDDIISVSDNCTVIEYDDGSDKTKNAAVSDIAVVIYNGQILDDYNSETLKPKDGNLRLIDNRDGSAFDIVFVTDYKTVIVNAISLVNKSVTNLYTYDEDNLTLNLNPEDEDIIKIYDGDGAEIEVKNLSVGDVLHVAESESAERRVVKAYLSRRKISDVVSAMRTADKTYVTLSGTEYALADVLKEAMAKGDANAGAVKVGTTYTFSFDTSGNIVYAKEDSGLVKYGLAMGTASDGVFNTNCSLKLLTSEGQSKVFKLAEYIEFNGTKRTPSETALGQIQTARDGVVSLVEYTLNSSGDIIKLKMPEVYNEANFNEFNTTGLNNLYYRGENNSFDAEIFVGKNPTMWFVQADAQGNITTDEEGYSVKSNGLYDDWAYKFYAYNLDEYRYSNLFVVLRNNTIVVNEMEFAELFVIDKVSEVINSDGEAVKMITGAMGKYESYSYYCDENLSVYNAKDSASLAEISVDDLKQGDVVLIHSNSKGDADRIELCRSLTDGEVYENPTVMYAKGAMLQGKVEKIDAVNGRLKINCGEKTRVVNAATNVPVILYDTVRDNIRVGTLADVEQGNLIMTRLKWLKTSGFIVFQ